MIDGLTDPTRDGLLELARVLWKRREGLERALLIIENALKGDCRAVS